MHNLEKKLLSPLKRLEKTTIISINLIAFSHKHSRVEPRFNEVAGDRLNSFVKSRYYWGKEYPSLYFFVKQRFVKLRFHCIIYTEIQPFFPIESLLGKHNYLGAEFKKMKNKNQTVSKKKFKPKINLNCNINMQIFYMTSDSTTNPQVYHVILFIFEKSNKKKSFVPDPSSMH